MIFFSFLLYFSSLSLQVSFPIFHSEKPELPVWENGRTNTYVSFTWFHQNQLFWICHICFISSSNYFDIFICIIYNIYSIHYINFAVPFENCKHLNTLPLNIFIMYLLRIQILLHNHKTVIPKIHNKSMILSNIQSILRPHQLSRLVYYRMSYILALLVSS